MIWIAIVGSAVATYLVRSIPFVVTIRGHLPDAASRYLDALPVAIIAALVGPAVVLFGQTRWLWIAFAGQLLSCLLMFVPASVRRLTADDAPTPSGERASPAAAAS